MISFQIEQMYSCSSNFDLDEIIVMFIYNKNYSEQSDDLINKQNLKNENNNKLIF